MFTFRHVFDVFEYAFDYVFDDFDDNNRLTPFPLGCVFQDGVIKSSYQPKYQIVSVLAHQLPGNNAGGSF